MSIQLAQTCNVCGRETGNLARHRPKCARAAGRPAVGVNLTAEDERLIYRAGTHAADEYSLPATQRWLGGVNDLDVARLVHLIEQGHAIVPTHGGRQWACLDEIPKMRMSLTKIVNEALRLKVVTQSTEKTARSAYRTFLVPAPTHARSADDHGKPACRLASFGPRRWRLLELDHLMYVDCQTCVDLPLSRVAKL